MLDLILAIGHHLLVFSLFGVLCAEFIAVRPGMTPTTLARVGAADLSYGAMAGLIIVVGFSRAVFATKGWLYYSHNAFFWAKIATFVVIGLLSVPPTLAFLRWRRAGQPPTDTQIAGVRRYLWAEVVLFLLLPAFAAAMARGYGEIS
jgi:putative membrane protein